LPSHVHASFAGPTDSSFAVNWRSDEATLVSLMLLGSDEALVASAEGEAEGVVLTRGHTASYDGILGGARIHEAHACGLEPSTRYFYKVGGPGAWSPVYEVATGPVAASSESFRFAVLGDARQEPGLFATLQEMIATDGADFQVFTGDAVQTGVNQADWDALFEATGPSGSIEPILAGVPMMMSNGNHDALALNYLMQFALPQELSPGESGAGEEWYSFDYGNAHFVVLNDTTASSETIDAESAFLAEDLAAVDRDETPWVFAMHHRPLYSCSNHGSDVDIRQAWQPIYDSFGVDIVFNGHDHNYERSHPIRGFQSGSSDGAIAAAGPEGQPVDGSGTVYLVAGGAGAPLYGSGSCYHTRVSESVRNYTSVAISGRSLSLRTYRLDGSLLDSFDYTK
ncbi:MAG: metallophosphoesterase family protein, partial [Myxococcales bacterium]|nr:metallophosphoesterase family protein [Myxococcales bacterium]